MSNASDFTDGLIERIWFGNDTLASVTRAVLMPAERLFGGIVGARDVLYDAGWLTSHATALPALSVGNLTVGGTGKTPIAAWIASELRARGARPAIILRGYGDDEPLVHQTLNPDVPVVLGADRVAAIVEAASKGADIAVLDDAFQHRQAQRVADLVLVSADRWTGEVHMLPAGPWREPLTAVRRASLVVVTRKAATEAQAEEVHRRIAEVAPGIPRVSVYLEPGELVQVGANRSEAQALAALDGRRVHVIASIGDPAAFIAQLVALGAQVRSSVFPDHHNFTAEEVEAVVREAADAEVVVCTLKDAVKLEPRWPRLAPVLWYVSQRVTVERGVGGIEHLLDDLVRARSATSRNAG
ncbi:MAG TPA: tetraacyldisaccharide 4'-kinase [Gemmatimonadaceae bacterium]